MRITSKMMINNAKYWLSKQTERLSDAETVCASGKQYSKPSDNPGAAAAILQYRSDISRYNQYENNLTQVSTLIETGEEVLDSVTSLLNQALDVVNELASGKSDYTDTYLGTLEELYQSIVDMANTNCSGTYMYGGSSTTSTPFSNEVTVSGGTSDDIMFYLSSNASVVTIEAYDSAGNLVRTITTTGTEGSNTVSWDGFDDSGTAVNDGTYTYSIRAQDASGNAVGASGYYYRGDSESRQIIIGDGTTVSINSDGYEIFNKTLMALSQIIASFENDTTTETAASVTDSLNSSIDSIAYERVALSNIYSQIDINLDKVDSLSTILKEKLSETENGDTSEAAVNLTAQQTAYEIATEAVAKILNLPKLSDYV
jgi:flagellin-like hook-associated protein FlgL